MINTWYQEARKSRFSNDYTRHLERAAEYLSTLGTGGDEVRDAFKRRGQKKLFNNQQLLNKLSKSDNPYGDGKAVKRIVKIIENIE